MASVWDAGAQKKKPEEENFLGTLGKNVAGAGEFLNPAKLVPAIVAGVGGGAASTAKELARLVPTTAASLTGADIKTLEESPLSFGINTELLKKTQDQSKPLAERFMGGIEETSPLLGQGAKGIAETGIRLGAEAAAPIAGRSAQELLADTNAGGISYGERFKQGQLFPTVVQDLLAVAPAARGLGGGLEKAGLPGAEAVTRAANVAERAPLAPYTVPAKGLYNAVRTAEAGGTAFPRLAAMAERPGLAGIPQRLGQGAENLAQQTGDIWRGTSQRAEALGQIAENEQVIRPQLEAMEQVANAVPEGPAREAILAERQALLDQSKAEALGEAKFNIQTAAREAKAGELGLPRRQVEVSALPKGFQDKAINQAFEGLDRAQASNAYVRTFDKVTSAWKGGVLPANPAWQAGNAVSNGITAMTFGDVAPNWYVKNIKRVAEQVKNPTEGGGMSIGAGQAQEFGKRAGQEATTKVGKAASKISEGAYKLNEVVDDQAHMAVYLHELDKLKAAGTPVKEAQALANKKALQTMGDFKNMSSVEKNYIKRAIPFYAWSKHAAKLTAREAMENPVKQLRLATVANKLGPPTPQEGQEFLEGQIALPGGKFLRLPGQMQHGLLGGLGQNPLTNPTEGASAINPIAQQILAAGGLDVRKMEKLEPGQGQSFLSGAAGYETNQIPLIKMLADLAEKQQHGGLREGTNVVKGSTRAPILSQGKLIKDTKQDVAGIPAPLLRFLTGASLDQPDLEAAAAREREKQKTEKKKTASYEKNLKKGKTKK